MASLDAGMRPLSVTDPTDTSSLRSDVDRDKLRSSSWVTNQERSCAVWASRIEREFRVGLLKEIAVHVTQVLQGHWGVKIEKSPIRTGLALELNQATTFRVHHDQR